jgi:hypothetical protein
MGLRYTVAALAILAAVLVFLLSAEQEGGVPLIDWIRDPAGSRERHELSLAQRAAEAAALEEELLEDSRPPPPRLDELDGPASLRGRALLLDGTPAAGLELAAALPAQGIAVTDEAGRFELQDVPPRTQVRIDGETWVLIGSGPQPLPGGGEELLLVVAERTRLVGRVVDEQGRPLQGALVVAFLPPALAASGEIDIALPVRLERRAMTDAQGRFEVEDLPLVPFLSVDVSKPDHLPVRRGGPDTPDEELEIVLQPLDGGGR